MSKTDLARWLKQEHRKTAELSRKLREALAAQPPGGSDEWLNGLRSLFEHFRAHLVRHIALEEEGGYLKPVVDARPTLTRHVEALRDQHAQFQVLMEGILHTLSRLRPDQDVMMRDAKNRITSLLECVEDHDQQENQIVLWVLNTDIGVGD